MNDYLERSKKEWARASEFPTDKESCYPDHTRVQEFDLHHNKSIYEYGCGGGSDVLSYLRRHNIVTATDIVPENVETTIKRVKEAGFEENANIILLKDSAPLPFPSDSFDIISSHGVLHHIRDPLPIVMELYRICKPGGLFYYMLYTDIMWDYFNELGMIDNFMRTYNIDKYEAFGYCTDNIGTPYSRPYTTEQACELSQMFGFKVLDYNHWLNDHFITVKCTREE